MKLKGRFMYVRVSPFVNENDKIDQYIKEAVDIKFSDVKSKSKVYTLSGHDRHQFVRYLAYYKRAKTNMSLYSEELLDIGAGVDGGEVKMFNIDMDFFYKKEDKNIMSLMKVGLSKKVFVGDNEWVEMKSLINDSLTTYSSFFETI